MKPASRLAGIERRFGIISHMSEDTEVQFVPFHAINQFMIPEYRQEILHKVFGHLDELPSDRKNRILSLFKRYVSVPGFRNSALAPLPIKIKNAGPAFDKYPDFVAQILMAWSELLPTLRQQVYDLLVERKWEMLPADTDRSKLPGFLVRWPKEETYDVLDAAFAAKYPDEKAHEYDIRLMIVWLAGRLPFDMVDEEE
jgi:hypothetical protein